MIRIYETSAEARKTLPGLLSARAAGNGGEVEGRVKAILSEVRGQGDEVLFRLARELDGAELTSLKVSEAELQAALEKVEPSFLSALQFAAERIRAYHEEQKTRSWFIPGDGTLMGQRVRPLKRVGIYVPGGRAFYPSTVLMNALPAKVAGVSELVAVTPPGKDGEVSPYVLAALKTVGVTEVYKAGGAQAVGALAYGTESIKRVDKIVGPGNSYVATAKRLVFGEVDIDMIAGPSEILIIAGDEANPAFIAADLLSQAEHDPLASSILLCLSAGMAERVKEEVEKQTKQQPRREIIEQSLKNYGAIAVMESLSDAIDFANELAPEHLELMVKDPMQYLGRIDNAGSIFLGENTPEALGDYTAGVNHVLPTGGTARFFSPLSVDSFMKKSSFLSFDRAALEKAREATKVFAEFEGFYAHANAVEVRFKKDE